MRAVALVLAAVVVCGCSSGGSADLDLGTAPPTTTTSAAEPTTTTSPPTTPEPTAAPQTTPAAPTTAATDPPTTLPPETTAPLSKEDQVRADYEAARLAREHCAYDPASCDYAAIAVPGSPMDIRTRELMAERLSLNLRAVEGHGSVQLRVENVGFEGESAYVTICAYDTVVIFDVMDPTNPLDDVIYNEEKNSRRVRWQLQQIEGRWLLYEGQNLETLSGGDLCGF